jgi:hypothetical protein
VNVKASILSKGALSTQLILIGNLYLKLLSCGIDLQPSICEVIFVCVIETASLNGILYKSPMNSCEVK